MSAQIQQLAESVLIAAMNGGAMAGMVFHHSDNPQRAKKNSVTAKAGPPVPQLEGPRGFRVEVEIEIKTATPAISAIYHGEIMQRLTSRSTLINAALSAGMTEDDDLYIFDEDISGDRQETKNLRKRTIVVPMLINLH